jgi:uncharacterized RDD family membrane protein YckC
VKPTYAGLAPRIAAFAFDYILIAGYLVCVVALGVLVRTFLPDLASRVFGSPLSGQLSGFCLVTAPISAYFVLLESSSWQGTWGKRKRNLKVVDRHGVRLTGGRALGRTVLKFIPWELAHVFVWRISFASPESGPWLIALLALVWILVAVNFLSVLVSREGQALYDRLAGTFVIRE